MDEIKKILIVILEPQNKTSTETNYFKGLKSYLKNNKWEHLFNNNIENIAIRSVKSLKLPQNMKIITDCKQFILPNVIFGIVDNDCLDISNVKKFFDSLVKQIKCEYNKIILPPKSTNFEYFISLHFLDKTKITLEQQKINSYVINKFDMDLSKYKSNTKIFDKLFDNGNGNSIKLFDNVTYHPICVDTKMFPNCIKDGICDFQCHTYKELVDMIFKKDIV